MILSNGTSLPSYSLAVLCFALAYYLLATIGYWNIFRNAGESRWKALVPVVRNYTQYRISWRPLNFWIAFLFTLVGCSILKIGWPALDFSLLNIYDMVNTFQYGAPLTYVGVAFLAGGYAINVCSLLYLGRSFGQNWGFLILACFFPTFARLGLGLSSVCYKGNVALAR